MCLYDCIGNMTMTVPIDFASPAHKVAHQLIGWVFTVNGVGGRIVETEAYDREDPASHSFSGLTRRNATMFGPPGHLYVYRSYGIHWCLNIVCCDTGHGAGVLIRALEPLEGIDIMRERRGLDTLRLLCAGPGRVCQALGITGEHDGLVLESPGLELTAPSAPFETISGPRIGITKARDVPWRFGLKGSPFLSRSFR